MEKNEKNQIQQIIEECRKNGDKYIDIIKDIFIDPKFSFLHISLKLPKDKLKNFYIYKKQITNNPCVFKETGVLLFYIYAPY